VIPYFKRPRTLLQTLHSISRLDYDLSKIDIVIVDDGSPIEDRPDLFEFFDKLNIKYLFQEDKGYRLSAARNLGIRHTQSEYIIILDCDLIVDPMFLEAHLNILSRSKNVISVGLRDSYLANDKINPKKFSSMSPKELKLELLKKDWRFKRLGSSRDYEDSNACWRLCSGGNLGFHKSLFDKIGEFNEQFTFWGGEDTEWAYRAYKKGAYFHIQREVLSSHIECHAGEFQISRSDTLEKRNLLLANLVPVYNQNEKNIGEVPYVSIFVTNYNKLEYLEECLLSVQNSTSYRFEIVIINDSDCNIDLVKNKLPGNLAAKVRVYNNEVHLGAEQSFKKAISLCRGEFIAQLDADDYLLPNAIDRLIYKLNRCDSDIAYSKFKVLKEGSLVDGWVCKDTTREMRLLKGMYYHPLRLFRSRAIHRVGGMRILGLKGAVDFSLYSQMELACKAVFCDVFTYVYRQIDNSITNTQFPAQIEGVRKVIEDNARLLSTTQDYKITQVKERLYTVDFSPNDTIEYIQHLGLIN
jgi:chondroitin synthase